MRTETAFLVATATTVRGFGAAAEEGEEREKGLALKEKAMAWKEEEWFGFEKRRVGLVDERRIEWAAMNANAAACIDCPNPIQLLLLKRLSLWWSRFCHKIFVMIK